MKYGTLAGHFSLDPLGYAGFSYYAREGRKQAVSAEVAAEFFAKLQDDLVGKRISKYAQSVNAETIFFDRYIFFPLQVVSDSVAVLKYAEPMDYLEELLDWGDKNNYGVVVKRHPKCTNVGVRQYLDNLQDKPGVQVADADVHDLIAGCDAVFTINSGSGAEALLHLKPVLLGGRADYQAAAVAVLQPKDIHAALDRVLLQGGAPAAEEVMDFVYSYTHDYMVGHDDGSAACAILEQYNFIGAGRQQCA